MPRILLADDDAAMRSFLTAALERAKHEVLSCEDGLKALEKLKTDAPFDLLLTDIVMPGMDGVELSKMAKTLYPDIKILFITGFSAIAAEQSASPDNDARVMSKPFHLIELIRQVNAILER
ncbi:MAG: response regulator [Rhodospirillales bacterium]|nr:response regulator [Alphaproteobacteria bacterium]USO03706.1 MAG: response regulator [Rhodospirillales bacterium]